MLKPILRGQAYYVIDYNERRLGILADPLNILGEALDRLGVEWVLTGPSALHRRGILPAEPEQILIFNDRFRHASRNRLFPRPVRFAKVSRRLLGFGYEVVDGLRVASPARAVLDLAYVKAPPAGGDLQEAAEELAPYVKICPDREGLKELAPRYPRVVGELVERALSLCNSFTYYYSLREAWAWELEVERAIEEGRVGRLDALVEYLPGLKDYAPVRPTVEEFLAHVRYVVEHCEELADDWTNLPSCDEIKRCVREALARIRPRRSERVAGLLDDRELIRLVTRSFGVSWR